MGKGWDYAELSKKAKESGGPEMLINMISSKSFDDGYSTGRKDQQTSDLIMLGVGFGAALFYKGLKKVVGFVRKRYFSDEEPYVTEEEAKNAKEILKEEIEDYDRRSQSKVDAKNLSYDEYIDNDGNNEDTSIKE